MLLLISQRDATAQSCSSLPSPNVTLINGQSITSSTTFTNQVILIPANSTVTFAADVTMSGCTLIMRENAVINIQDSRFTLQNNGATRSLITGCEKMWSSIQLNSRAKITFTSSDIRHGRNALSFNSGSVPNQCSIVDCKFEGNQICISATNLGSFSPIIKGNLFDGYSSNVVLLAPMTGLFSNLLQVSAFELSQVTGNLSGAASPNQITHMTTGYQQTGGNMVVNNFSFSANTEDEPEETSNGGYACRIDNGVLWLSNCAIGNNTYGSLATNNAFVLGSLLNVSSNIIAGLTFSESSGIIQRSSFNNNPTGILAKRANLTIGAEPQYGALGNSFSNNGFGFRSSFSRFTNVINNTFNDQSERDLSLSRSQDINYHALISHNTCTLNGLPLGSFIVNRPALANGNNTDIFHNSINVPIAVDGIGYNNNRDMRLIEVNAIDGATDQAWIRDNTITCNYGNGPSGGRAKTIDGIITLDAVDGYQVIGNTLNFINESVPNDSISAVGIGMIGVTGVNHHIYDNTINSVLFAGQENQRESWLRCGIHVDGSPNAEVCFNHVDEPKHVYHFLNNCTNIEFAANDIIDGYIGLANWGTMPIHRHHRHNLWTGNYQLEGAESVNQSDLDWHVADNSEMPPSQNIPWFNPGPGDGTQASCIGTEGFTDEPRARKLLQDFTEGVYTFTQPAAQLDFELDLLEALIRDPEIYEGFTPGEDYYAAKLNTPLWQLANAKQQLRSAAALSPADEQLRSDNIAVLYQDMSILESSLSSIMVNDSTVIVDPVVNAAAERVLQWNNLSDQLDADVTAGRASVWSAIGDYIEQIPTDSTEWLTHQRFLLLLRVKTYLEQPWSHNDSVQLLALARLCPAKNGIVVTLAREMLPDEVAYAWHRESDDPFCAAGSRNVHTNIESISSAGVSVFPNPVKDQMMLMFESQFEGKIKIISAGSGAIIQTIPISAENSAMLNFDYLPSGAYIIHAIRNDGAVMTCKFNVTR